MGYWLKEELTFNDWRYPFTPYTNEGTVFGGITADRKNLKYRMQRTQKENGATKCGQRRVHHQLWQDIMAEAVVEPWLIHHWNHNPKDNALDNLVKVSRPWHNEHHKYEGGRPFGKRKKRTW